MPKLKGLKNILTEQVITNQTAFLVMITFVGSVLLFTLLLASLMPDRLDVNVGDPAPRAVYAPKQMVDEKATEQARQMASEAVGTVYTRDPAVFRGVLDQLDGIFSVFKNSLMMDTAQRITLFRRQLPAPLNQLDPGAIGDMTEEELDGLKSLIAERINTIMELGVKEGGLDRAKDQLAAELGSLDLESSRRELAVKIGVNLLQVNEYPDWAATQERKQQAAERVPPVVIPKDKLLIMEGATVTEDDMALLRELGLVRGHADYGLMLGVLLLTLISVGIIGAYLVFLDKPMISDRGRPLLLGIIFILVLAVGKVVLPLSGFLVPVAGAAMLVTILLDAQTAFVFATVISMLLYPLGGGDWSYSLTAFTGSVLGIYATSHLSQRSDIARAGLIVGAANVLAIVAAKAIFQQVGIEMVYHILLGFFGGLLSAVLTIGSLFYFEQPFGVTSSIKLLELANPNHPLLKRLMVEAPGTYHHSVVVANLAEAAAGAIGADPLLARVAAYYHDIGKLKRPNFFIENQVYGGNPHDKAGPGLSTIIVTSHIKDGVELAGEYKLPQVIKAIIPQHHGTSLLTFFYQKALDEARDQNVSEDSFRYEGPKPKSKEAALIMLADSVEAAARSFKNPTPGRLEGLVRRIIKEKLEDEQLDESALTFQDLDVIARSFSRILIGIAHNRIPYPSNPEGGKVRGDSHK